MAMTCQPSAIRRLRGPLQAWRRGSNATARHLAGQARVGQIHIVVADIEIKWGYVCAMKKTAKLVCVSAIGLAEFVGGREDAVQPHTHCEYTVVWVAADAGVTNSNSAGVHADLQTFLRGFRK